MSDLHYCPHCQQHKPISAFRTTHGRPKRYCKECQLARRFDPPTQSPHPHPPRGACLRRVTVLVADPYDPSMYVVHDAWIDVHPKERIAAGAEFPNELHELRSAGNRWIFFEVESL